MNAMFKNVSGSFNEQVAVALVCGSWGNTS